MKKPLVQHVESDKVPKGSKRSSKWPATRKAFLAKNPQCAVCGTKKNLQVHHKMPFHLDPDKENSFDNLITLCEDEPNGFNCHRHIGHLFDFKAYNADVEKDAAEWNLKIKNRPYAKDKEGR